MDVRYSSLLPPLLHRREEQLLQIGPLYGRRREGLATLRRLDSFIHFFTLRSFFLNMKQGEKDVNGRKGKFSSVVYMKELRR